MNKSMIAGVGMVKFAKPGQHPSYREMASEAIRSALNDAGLSSDQVEQVFASFIFEGSGSGQHAVYDVFQNGIPIVNLNNACASGSSGLYLARQLTESGAAHCVLVVGFDEMPQGAIPQDLPTEMVGRRIEAVLDNMAYETSEYGDVLRWFGAAGLEYMKEFSATPDLFAKIAVKNRTHAANNPLAVFTSPITEEQVLEATPLYGNYMTKFMACPPTSGAAAAVVVSSEFAKTHGLKNCIEIVAQSMATDTEKSWSNAVNACGADNTSRAAAAVYEQSGLSPSDIDVIELHDCFTTNEAISYEGLQLCAPGGATDLVNSGDVTYGGKWVVNPSGGLMSKGHPVGATGLAQCCELSWHLRGIAGTRQVKGATTALQHNIGLVGAAVVTLYRRA